MIEELSEIPEGELAGILLKAINHDILCDEMVTMFYWFDMEQLTFLQDRLHDAVVWKESQNE